MKFTSLVVSAALLLLLMSHFESVPAQVEYTPEGILKTSLADYEATRTLQTERDEFLRYSREDNIAAALTSDEIDEDKWRGAFWTAGLIGDRRPLVYDALVRCFESFDELSPRMRRVVVQSAHGLYPGRFGKEARSVLHLLEDPKAFAIGCYVVLQADRSTVSRIDLVKVLEEKFPDWEDEPRLVVLGKQLKRMPDEMILDRPSMVDMFAAPFVKVRPVIYSIQRVDRKYPGLAVIRQSDGSFLRNADGSIWNITHLAHAQTDMPGTISLGNTPQGLFAVRGLGKATNRFIGPTPYLYSKVPYEGSVAEFYHTDDPTTDTWSKDLYKGLLPQSWRTYFPFYEAWYAGVAGRSEMILHGTTINPDAYRGRSYYPLTPSAGCLCTIELWSPETGKLAYSEQLSLVQNFIKAGGPDGYLAVVELNARGERVKLADIIRDLLDAEKRMLSHSAE
jgi:hypothetical protein